MCGCYLDFYLEHTKHWRSGSGHKQLLLSFVKPHKEVKKSTISGWVKQVLKESGVNQARRSKIESGGAEPYIPYIPLMIEKKIII